MKLSKTHIITSIVTGGFFLLIDQYLKYVAYHRPTYSYYIWNNWIGWEYFENPGIAFGIPVPSLFVIVVTPIIILYIMWWIFYKNTQKNSLYGSALIIAGACSNFIDRTFYSFTIDYIRIFTSLINIADVLIIIGAWLIILEHGKKTRNKK